MTFALDSTTDGASAVANAKEPDIRLFTVPRAAALEPRSDTLPASWQVCAPETAKEFSGVAYFFARKLYEELHVPIGIILSAWPGTTGEEWTDADSLRDDPILQPIVAKWNARPAAERDFWRNPSSIELQFDDFELLPKQQDAAPQEFSNFDDGSTRTWPDGVWTFDWNESRAMKFDLIAPGRSGAGYAARISGALDGATYPRLRASFHDGAAPMDLSAFDGVRFFVRGTGKFVFKTLQPTIWDWDDYGAGVFRATPAWQPIEIHFSSLKQEGWGIPEPLTINALSGIEIVALPLVADPPVPPSGLYDAMIAPLVPYRIRGAIWYQGESNALRAFQYRSLLPAMIAGWRDAWREGNFPFLIVQLPNFGTSPELGDSAWAELREAELMTAEKVADAGLAVTIDIGESGNLHPHEKYGVGERLALDALGTTYGKKIVYSGPLFQSYEVEGNQIRVKFADAGSGLEARGGGELKGFAIAGTDRKFHWAEARIEGDSVIVSSGDVPAPVAVRYAWANSPDCNLYNQEGLPASPFRTDDWPGMTHDAR
jgi:sialate O-acetylesterase